MIATRMPDTEALKAATGEMRLYRLDPPLSDEYSESSPFEYVVVSATHAMFSGPETYIFPADETGEITSWGELDGSFKGALDHEQALRNAGYEVAENRGPVVTYDRMNDSGGSSFLCCCKKGSGVERAEHEDWCHAAILADLLVAGQGLYDAEAGNMRAEAASAWEQAVGRVGQVRGKA